MPSKELNPWSEGFYNADGGFLVKDGNVIEHYGNKNSGRYKRGSGKNPKSVIRRQQRQDNKDMRNIHRNVKRIGKKMMRETPEWKATKGKRVAAYALDSATIPITVALTGFGGTFASTRATNKSYSKSRNALVARNKDFGKLMSLNTESLRKTPVAELKKTYNSPEIRRLESQYLKNPKQVSQSAEYLNHTAAGKTVWGCFAAMAEEKKNLIPSISEVMRSGLSPSPGDRKTYQEMSKDERVIAMVLALAFLKALNSEG